MNAETRELVDAARELGFTETRTTGSGHVQVIGPHGTVTLPSTGSDWRGRKNAVAEMERMSGRKLTRAKRRRSHKSVKPSGFRLDVAVRECREWHAKHDAEVQQLHERRDQLIAECRDLSRDRTLLKHIPKRLDALKVVEERLRERGVIFDPFDPFTLA